MADHRTTKTAAAINEAAAIWLLRMEAPTSAQLRQEFQQWLDAEPRHRVAFIRLGLAWYTSETLELLRRCRQRALMDGCRDQPYPL